MLRNYSRAIKLLSPHFAKRDTQAKRIALIACTVFTCAEFLRGRFRTARAHLCNGLGVLKELYDDGSTRDGEEVVCLKRSRDASEQWIAEALGRLQLQVVLWDYMHNNPQALKLQVQVEYSCGIEPLGAVFSSFEQAWWYIQHYLTAILTLDTAEQRSCVLASLAQWSAAFTASRDVFEPKEFMGRGWALLKMWHLLLTIMASTCLLPSEAHTADFEALLEQAALLLSNGRQLEGQGLNMAHSVVDLGWIPPLYYTALKCRSYGLRMRAVELLEGASHREGIWDSRIASVVARRVVEVEERGRDGVRTEERLDVGVVLPDGVGEGIGLVCRRGGSVVVAEEYD